MLGINIKNNNVNINIFGVYKAPQSDYNTFIVELKNTLRQFKNTIYCGDFNLNLLNVDNDSQISGYINNIICNGFIPLNMIEKHYVTRRNIVCGSIIDHIITDLIQHKYSINLHDTHITDHRYIHITIKLNNSKNSNILSNSEPKLINVIDYSKITQTTLTKIINWTDVESFLYEIQKTITENRKTIKIDKKNESISILKLIKTRNYFFKLKLNYPTNEYLKKNNL